MPSPAEDAAVALFLEMESQAGFSTKPVREIDVPAPDETPWQEPRPAEPVPVEEPVPA